MSTTSEALVQLAEQKEQLRQIANRYLDSTDRLPVDCTLQDIIDVLNEYDEYSYMNAFLNSIEVFPDKDYSINDTEGHIKGLRPYAFYNNTALKSLYLPNATEIDNVINGCTNLEYLSYGTTAIDVAQATYFSTLPKLAKVMFPKLNSVNVRYNTSLLFRDCPLLKNISFPNCLSLSTGNANANFCGGTTVIDTFLMKGGYVSLTDIKVLKAAAFIITDNEAVATNGRNVASSLDSTYRAVFYVPASLLASYQSATNWTLINDVRPIQQIESNINTLRGLGADFSYTPYANKKWDGTALVTDNTIGEEVDE